MMLIVLSCEVCVLFYEVYSSTNLSGTERHTLDQCSTTLYNNISDLFLKFSNVKRL